MSLPPVYPCKPEEEAHVRETTIRWLERAVIGLNLCPFAKSVHVKRQIRYTITAATTEDQLLEELEHELRYLAHTPIDQVETTLLVHPRVLGRFLDFHFFVNEADALLRRLELDGELQIASFHPEFEFAGTDADDVENCSNRSPWPTLHLLREASIDRAVAAFPDAADIYERNIDTLRALGHAGWQQLFAERDEK